MQRLGQIGHLSRIILKSQTRSLANKGSFSMSSFQEISKRLQAIKQQNIRNFSIIAHIDHGKSTLADRLLELTGTIDKLKEKSQQQYLDKLKVEKDRGITVKAQTAAMFYNHNGEDYLLNLIDTPGHIDFNYEVSRSLRSCQGALLLVDSTQGIQAQTMSNYELAKAEGLKIIPVLNKIDMPAADVDGVKEEVLLQFNFEDSEVHMVSAKTGLNVEKLIHTIIEKIPPPKGDRKAEFRGFLIDSWFMKDRGVVCLFQVLDGMIKKKDRVISCAFQKSYDVFDVGIMHPEMTPTDVLSVGQVGFLATNMKSAAEARIGDTFGKVGNKPQPMPGFQPAKNMVFAGIYPEESDDYEELQKAMYKLQLTDPSVKIEKENSAALGNGFRCGFLGLLHMDVFQQRLEDEYEISTIVTMPSVVYRCKMRATGKVIEIDSAAKAPDLQDVLYIEEPIAEITMIAPFDSSNTLMSMCKDRRGEQTFYQILNEKRVIMKYKIPLSEIITDFFDRMKSITSGYGSLDYELKGYEKADIQKMVILLHYEPCDALSFMVHKDRAADFGKNLVKKLKDTIPQQLFVITLQAKLGGKVIAREDIPCLKRNVTAKCYGGDYSRKKKLIERQKEGKKKLRMFGKVEVGKETFIAILRND